MLSTYTPNGNLKFEMEPADIDQIELMLERHGGNDLAFLHDMLDSFGFLGNGQLYPIYPEDVGALTDAPLLSNEVEYLEDGGRLVRGDVWWYLAYERFNFAEELLTQGAVTFTRALH